MIIPIIETLLLCVGCLLLGVNGVPPDHAGQQMDSQGALGMDIEPESYREACPDYRHYAVHPQYATNTLLSSISCTCADTYLPL